jgi:hypothetical protein
MGACIVRDQRCAASVVLFWWPQMQAVFAACTCIPSTGVQCGMHAACTCVPALAISYHPAPAFLLFARPVSLIHACCCVCCQSSFFRRIQLLQRHLHRRFSTQGRGGCQQQIVSGQMHRLSVWSLAFRRCRSLHHVLKRVYAWRNAVH